MTLLSSLLRAAKIGAVGVVSLLVCSHVVALPRQGTDDEGYGIGPRGYSGTEHLVTGELDFYITAPGYTPVAFRAAAFELTGYPGSLICPQTPFGAAGLLLGTQPSVAEYYMGFSAIGNVTPMAWDQGRLLFQGDFGTAHIEITQTPVFTWEPGTSLTQGPAPQGPPAPKLEIKTYATGAPNENGVRITSTNNGDVIFVQFASVNITWKGTKVDGSPTSGGCPGPITSSGNAGHPMNVDGSTTYVDANAAGNGDYPYQGPGAGPNERSMIDVPNVKNSKPIANLIAGANPGVTITEITMTVHITTYVIVVDAAGRHVVAKIQWTYTETLTPPWGPDPGNGKFGGPAQGPPPPGSHFWNGQATIEPVNAMDPNHAAALTNFQAGTTYGGAPSNGSGY